MGEHHLLAQPQLHWPTMENKYFIPEYLEEKIFSEDYGSLVGDVLLVGDARGGVARAGQTQPRQRLDHGGPARRAEHGRAF